MELVTARCWVVAMFSFFFFLFDECESALGGGERDQEGGWGGRGG